jgi:hypothetical protein
MIDLASDIHYTEVYVESHENDDIYFEALIRFATGLPLSFQDKAK